MLFDKKAITQWVGHRCERQLGLSLWAEAEQKRDAEAAAAGKAAMGIPHRQLRPGLQQMAKAGNEWQARKVADLLTAFGPAAVVGVPSKKPLMNGPGDYLEAEYAEGDLAKMLVGAQPGQFLVEAEFDPINPTFEAQWRLAWRSSIGLRWRKVRPDIIQVGRPGQFIEGLTTDGTVVRLAADERVPLRVIDAKLSSEPGPGYFAEVTYYSLALAAWLEDNGLDGDFVVAASAALWPGSFEISRLRIAHAKGESGSALMSTLDEDLEAVPTQVFVSEITRFFHEILERVARAATRSTWQATLAWHVVPSCSGCDYLGQAFPHVKNPGESSKAHPNHCVPMAEATDHLSRLPFLPRGGTTVLGRIGVQRTTSLASRQPNDACFDEHHSLRAGRQIIPARAQALAGVGTIGVVGSGATTASIPKWSDLSLFVTADFDPTSAITLAFGLSGTFSASKFGAGAGSPFQPIRTAVYMVQHRDMIAERHELSVFLQAIHQHLANAQKVDPKATVQLYLWDTLTFEHLTRVIGRHLDWLLASNQIANLAWLFPPEHLVQNPTTAKTPAISVVGDAVRAIVATSQPHTYTLLGTAEVYNEGPKFDTNWLRTPGFWTTEFSDQIPGERAFDIWTRKNTPSLPFSALVGSLERTVRARHGALATVVRRLRDDLKGTLHRDAPRVCDLLPPNFVSGASLLGSLLYTHARLNAAAQWQETARLRAGSPTEREARFVSIRCRRRLLGAERDQALADLGVSGTTERLVFEIDRGSAEAKAEAGDFQWAVSPEGRVGLLDESLYRAVKEAGLENRQWWQDRPPWIKTFEGALQVTISAFDREKLLVAFDVTHPQIVKGLVGEGLVDLRGPCILDQIAGDFLSSKVKKAARAIKNPPKAAGSEAAIRLRLGVTKKGPRTTASNPAEDYLWDPAPLETIAISRPTAALQAALRSQFLARGDSEPDPSQWSAWEHALTRRLTVIWGPPGTGKSRTLGAVLDAVALDGAQRGQQISILVTAGTYTAVDNVLRPFASRTGAAVPTFRVRSGLSPNVPSWATKGSIDVRTDDAIDMQRLVDALNSGGPMVVGATPQQAQKVIEEATGSAAGQTFDYVIIDEAGQMDVAQAFLVLAGVTSNAQVVIAGDPLQLPPIHQVEAPEVLVHDVGPIYSFFKDKHCVPECVLLMNYRSNAEIVDLARTGGYRQSFVSSQPGLRLPSAPAASTSPPGWPVSIDWDPAFGVLADPDRPVICVTYPEGVAGQWNQFEADLTTGAAALIVDGLKAHLVSQPADWLWTKGIGVVTPHTAQKSLIRSGLQAAFPGHDASWVGAAVDTVERFQGQERWVILGSYAVGDPDTISQEADFLQNLNRFNVLATRAKAKVIVMVSDELLSHIATDIEVIRTSVLLKSFAETFCDQRASIVATFHDTHRGPIPVPLTVRWRA